MAGDFGIRSTYDANEQPAPSRAAADRNAAPTPLGLALEARRRLTVQRDDALPFGTTSEGVDRAATQKALGGEHREEGGRPCRSSWIGEPTLRGRTQSCGATCSASTARQTRRLEVDDAALAEPPKSYCMTFDS